MLTAALDSDLKLEVVHTERRGHAAELARQARVDGLDLLVVLGGDGTVNEAVNGLLAEGPHPAVPDLAVVPGGGTNVFARALDLPRDPVEATGALLDALREGRRRAVGLAMADDRWFTFSSGMGLDAEVVAAVDARRRRGATIGNGAYVRAAVRHFFTGTDRRHPALRVEADGRPAEDPTHLVIVSNAAPWTYWGDRPVQPTPGASFDTGLDVYGLRNLRTVATLRQVRQLLQPSGRTPRGRQVLSLHDLDQVTVRADRPTALQVDGEPLGDRTQVVFRAVPAALRVVR